MVEQLAIWYVDIIEPALRVLAVVAFVVTLLYIINIVKDPKKKADVVGKLFNFMLSVFTGFFRILGKSLLYIAKVLYKTLRVLWATARDFFVSQI